MLKHNMQPNRDFTEIEAEMANMSALLYDIRSISRSLCILSRTIPNSRHARGHCSQPLTHSAVSSLVLDSAQGFIAAHRAALTDLLEDYVRAIRWFDDPTHRDEALQIVASVTKRPVSLFEKWLFIPGKGYYRGPTRCRISMR